jgi:hypothetical protein
MPALEAAGPRVAASVFMSFPMMSMHFRSYFDMSMF